MKTRSRLRGKTISAIPTSQHEVVRFKSDAIKQLRIAGVKADEKLMIVPGLSQNSEHRAVFLKCREKNKSAFKIELGISPPDDNIAKTFTCPKLSCDFQNKTYKELANHHWIRHRKNGETIEQSCCGKFFPFFELFCEHVYKHHRNKSNNTIRPCFDIVREEKFHDYLIQQNVGFLESFEIEVTFNHLLDLAGQIILSFDHYWIFMWNCQDFTVWYLYSLGIPLKVLDPTVSDKITGSNKDCSARKVQGFKGWAWYKQPHQLQKFSSIADQARYTCSECEFLPPLTIEALNLHDQLSHRDPNTNHSDSNVLIEREICHYLRGDGQGLSLSIEPTRKWNVYRHRGKSTTDHESIVFRPWILNDDKDELSVRPSEIFVSLEKRAMSDCPFVDDMAEKYQGKLEKCCEIAVSIQELSDYISLVYDGVISKGRSKTCVEYVYYMLKMVFRDKNADRQAFVVQSVYTRHRAQMRQILYGKIENIIDNEIFAVDVHSTVGSDTLTLQARVAQVGTSLYGKFQTMLPLHMMFMMSLLYFATIGELLFPLLILFTCYLMYCVLFSHFRKMGKRWMILKISTNLNAETKLRLIQDVSHVVSMTYMIVEVCLDLEKLQSMVFLQMVWLNFLFLSREVEKTCTKTERHFLGLQRPTVFRLLLINIKDDFFRLCVIVTFLMPAYIIRIFIPVEFILIIVFSRAFPRWCKLKYFTGNENLEFHLVLFSFLLIMSGILFYTGDVIKPVTSVSNIHIVLFVIYFSISFWIDSKEALQRVQYVEEIGKPYQSDINSRGNRECLHIYLSILCKIVILSLVLVIFGLIFLLCTSDFQTMLVYISLAFYTHCVSVCTAVDVKDIMMALIEEVIKKGNPTLQHSSLI